MCDSVVAVRTQKRCVGLTQQRHNVECCTLFTFRHRVHENDQPTGTEGNSDSVGDVGFILFFRDPL